MSVRKTANGSTPEHRYRWEMNDADHERLAGLLRTLKGAVIISSYPSEFYDGLFHGWRKMGWTSGQFCSANTNAQTRTEMVWMNDAAWRGVRPGLFDEAEAVAI
jgi:DNA adenine methylase